MKILSIFTSSILFAGAIAPNVMYQDYLDLAYGFKKELKVYKNDLSVIDFKIQAPSFYASNNSGKFKREFTNIGASYIIGASHLIQDYLKQNGVLEFSNIPTYVINSNNNFKKQDPNSQRDFSIFRTHKININESANLFKKDFYVIQNANSSDEIEKYQDNMQTKKELLDEKRYSLYVRSGTGVNYLGFDDFEKGVVKLNDSDVIASAGILYLDKDKLTDINIGRLDFNAGKNSRLDFTNNIAPGDSGSAIYVYDSVDKKYYVIGVASKSDCKNPYSYPYNCTYSKYETINSFIINDFKNSYTINTNESDFKITNANLSAKNTILNAKSNDIAFNHTYTNYLSKDTFNKRLESLKDDKDVVFNKASKIVLESDADFGSSVFYFNEDSSIVGNKKLLLGGIVVNKNATLSYDALSAKNDFLHKIGDGVLIINNSSQGAGINIGGGEVILNNKDNKNSFSNVYITNQAKLSLNQANTLDTNNLYIADNAATINLNSNDLSFTSTLKNTSYDTVFTGSAKLNFNIKEKNIFNAKINSLSLNADNSTIIFDNTINANDFVVNNSNITLQAQASQHYYLDSINQNIANKNNLSYLSSPREFKENNFTFNTINLNNNSSLTLNNSNLNAKEIKLKDSSLNLAENAAFYAINNIKNNAGINFSDAGYSVDKTFSFTQELKESTFNNTFANLKANLSLDNSSIKLNKNSSFTGKITGVNNSSLIAQNAILNSSINIENINANNSIFNINANSQSIISTKSSSGQNNALNVIINPDEDKDKILLASLANTQDKNFFTSLKLKDAFSISRANIVYEQEENTANWYLQKTKEGKTQDLITKYFITEENKEATKAVNTSLEQAFFSFVLEWNNLTKRMGDLRKHYLLNNDDYAGFWARLYHGQSSYLKSNKSVFLESQFGVDKRYLSDNAQIFSGVVFNIANYKFNSPNLDGNSNSFGLGIYSSILFDNGFYLDLIAKYLMYKNNYDFIITTSNTSVKNNKINHNFIASIEAGFYAYLNDYVYFNPQLELISGYLSKQEIESNFIKLSSKSTIPLSLKSAVFAGYDNEYLGIRFGLGLASDLKNSADKIVSDRVFSKTYAGKKDTRMFVNLGTSYVIDKKQSFNFEFEKSFFGDLNIDYSINLVYRYAF
ncbi:autotransporter outer membrane beta-barrel domain-containing protein [Campylobacter canadensis]|uniref:autotransporter outer membrane beta-barrel domain-containing protein n=1 Tax=Campylobacter canadensis TaxID=449520 RepID=UPI001552BD03|nr:autotransporter outer membrane beta-barrel domain-containing protein [Campylobacter canadensis]MBZ7995259.1 autotransporter outer membrane beta-barrel domain-containing protein [Campylobacter canadensis]MBZ7996777.1 autotransporter outer membrane beta-barrel domain-containing protein [Campylobacter canadensis]MBZ8000643.1 autotransporter outer membrane beta-barrel domain-containing protein [Campylobacter canadensis]MBZ8001990.1 autotransporter outer membrane beta-barrel domain-containing pro